MLTSDYRVCAGRPCVGVPRCFMENRVRDGIRSGASAASRDGFGEGQAVVSDVSRTRLGDEFAGALGRLSLQSDGSFVAAAVPRDLWHRAPAQVVPPISGTGTWTLASSRSGTIVHLVFTQIAKEDHLRAAPDGTVGRFVETGEPLLSRRELYYLQKGDRDQATSNFRAAVGPFGGCRRTTGRQLAASATKPWPTYDSVIGAGGRAANFRRRNAGRPVYC